jgi:hypothetical protein
MIAINKISDFVPSYFGYSKDYIFWGNWCFTIQLTHSLLKGDNFPLSENLTDFLIHNCSEIPSLYKNYQFLEFYDED